MAERQTQRQSYYSDLQMKAFRAGVTPRTNASMAWFRKQMQAMGDGAIKRNTLLKDDQNTVVARPIAGNMYMFFYDAKHKDTLPYYDQFPLIMMVGPAKGGFYGLNFHYLHPTLRAKLFDMLKGTMNNQNYDETTRMRLSYQVLNAASKMKYFRPCFKHYLTSQLDSKLSMVDPVNWEISLFMPTHQFSKKSARGVWADSKRSV